MQNYIPNNNQIYPNQSGPQYPPSPNPNYAGVNIQIVNPMVNPAGNGYVYPQQTASAYAQGTNGGCYPACYYTTPGYYGYQPAQPLNGFYDSTGKFYPYVQDENGQIGYYDDNGKFHPLNNGTANPNAAGNGSTAQRQAENAGQTSASAGQPSAGETQNAQPQTPSQQQGKPGFYDNNGKFHEFVTGPNGETGYYDDNGKFNPVNLDSNGAPQSANNANSQNSGSTEGSKSSDAEKGEKTEKRTVVTLSDDYIKTLENYLNSQDTKVRKMGAVDVIARLDEDPSRKDDPALTALINKMIQDPSTTIRALGLSALEAGTVSGNKETVDLLKQMQKSDKGFGLDAQQATSILLRMAGKTEEKEVPVRKVPGQSAPGAKKSSRPAMPFFNTDKEKYDWLMKYGCTSPSETRWLSDYVKNNSK
ncbi:MAG: hypothetical protein II085_00720 [Alphaproteobacteria bacterium]|nr:hypothetical protein [Alphaproteobacteria bacterium]